MREINSLREEVLRRRKAVDEGAAQVTAFQNTCAHQWKVHSQRLKNEESKKWWIHRICTLCDSSDSKLEDVPICPDCQQPMRAAEGPRAEEARTSARTDDPYATIAFAFECTTCDSVRGFPFRGPDKKK